MRPVEGTEKKPSQIRAVRTCCRIWVCANWKITADICRYHRRKAGIRKDLRRPSMTPLHCIRSTCCMCWRKKNLKNCCGSVKSRKAGWDQNRKILLQINIWRWASWRSLWRKRRELPKDRSSRMLSHKVRKYSSDHWKKVIGGPLQKRYPGMAGKYWIVWIYMGSWRWTPAMRSAEKSGNWIWSGKIFCGCSTGTAGSTDISGR